jgi:hypothetical protein
VTSRDSPADKEIAEAGRQGPKISKEIAKARLEK